jgi:hypothetical protein
MRRDLARGRFFHAPLYWKQLSRPQRRTLVFSCQRPHLMALATIRRLDYPYRSSARIDPIFNLLSHLSMDFRCTYVVPCPKMDLSSYKRHWASFVLV